MKSSIKLRRSLIGTATALALILTAAAALPTQAAQLTDSLRTAYRHVCERFCGCHHHHHCHDWCDGYRHFHCPGHD